MLFSSFSFSPHYKLLLIWSGKDLTLSTQLIDLQGGGTDKQTEFYGHLSGVFTSLLLDIL